MIEVADLLALQRATHAVVRALEDELRELRLSASEINAIASLPAGDGVRLRDLALATGQRTPTMTGVVDRLERSDLVRRTPDAVDRRSVRVQLTERGAVVQATVLAAYELVASRAVTTLEGGPDVHLPAALAALESVVDHPR
jgi:DNA-binding MarR family transcriptional regulator